MIKLNQISPQISRPDVPHLNFPIPGQMVLMDRPCMMSYILSYLLCEKLKIKLNQIPPFQARCSSWTDFLMVPSLPSVLR